MFNKSGNDLLEIKPINEPNVDIDKPQEEIHSEDIVIPQEEIFKAEKNITMEVEPGVMTKAEVNAWGKKKIRGVGKRGPDKKKRVKKPPSEKQLAHLKRMRALASQKRAVKALEKKKQKAEALRIQKELEALKPTTAENTKRLQRAIIQPPSPAPAPAPGVLKRVNKKVHYATNTPRQNPNTDEMFFNLMDRYEQYKEAKNMKIKAIEKEKTLQARLNEKRRNNPHPNRRIPQLQRPAPPVNIYDDIFNYKGRL